MKAATFCLAPRGRAAWSPRLDEAILAGCIPVIIAEYYDPPYAGLLDYSTFSVSLREDQAGPLTASSSFFNPILPFSTAHSPLALPPPSPPHTAMP